MTGPSSEVQVISPQKLTRNQRLDRWALALEKLGDTPLRTIRDTEQRRPDYERQLLRVDNSPLTVAFEESVLQSAGLEDDTFGAARRFFDLTDWELYNILSDYHFNSTVRATDVAKLVRSLEARDDTRGGRVEEAKVKCWSLIGWLASALGLALWGYGYFATGTTSFIDWQAVAPTWIATYLPSVEAEVGFLLMMLGSIPIYWATYRHRS